MNVQGNPPSSGDDRQRYKLTRDFEPNSQDALPAGDPKSSLPIDKREIVAECIVRIQNGESIDHVIADCRKNYPGHAEEIIDALKLESSIRSQNESEAIPTAIGEYQINRVIGTGGMGVVYEAFHQRLGRRVAIKTLKKQDAKPRFLNEQHILAQFHQSNIVALHEAGETDGEPYIVMPYINGATLTKIVATAVKAQSDTFADSAASTLSELADLAQKKKPTPAPARRQRRVRGKTQHRAFRLPQDYYRSVAICVTDLARAIATCHRQNIVHRDLKPDNVMVDKSGRSWIIDFGIATRLNSEDDGTSKSTTNSPAQTANRPAIPQLLSTSGIAGTWRYMAPEQLEQHCGKSTDIWGLGMILYELLAFRHAISETAPKAGAGDRA